MPKDLKKYHLTFFKPFAKLKTFEIDAFVLFQHLMTIIKIYLLKIFFNRNFAPKYA
ncbi:hypothetical protein SAMN05660862_2035 [Sphingobacterium psychroaquaticum]|uniref:Uncharacterized protein n=1 Tax=Sphingobacterium psychroaquaticum TaxID=561061 RepID=A0A1X7JR56_9SPHI|nr:hypothetical protein SAMN05660862_2035 [Sphingobacterium psychroaquaticum]